MTKWSFILRNGACFPLVCNFYSIFMIYIISDYKNNIKHAFTLLEKVQRRAALWTTSNYDYRSSVTSMIENLGWRTLEQRRSDARLCLFYRIVYGLVAVPIPDYIQSKTWTSKNCHSMTFYQIHTHRNFSKYSFFPLAIVQWNALPESVVCLPTLDAFKEDVGKLHHSRP